MLAWSLQAALAPAASLRDKLTAAEFLVACGLSDEADAAIKAANARMRASGVTGGPATVRLMERLSAVSRRFREGGLAPRLKKLGNFGTRLLDDDEEAVL